jgi:hypothetical protein
MTLRNVTLVSRSNGIMSRATFVRLKVEEIETFRELPHCSSNNRMIFGKVEILEYESTESLLLLTDMLHMEVWR